ncbi:type IV pilus assembly protein PilM [Candidatus Parcubacteria bacterium]|nr:type IV pilus assembly protein PilM [Candidatus Parcubacteria bacterium]
MKFLTLEKEAFGLDISDQSLKIVKLKKRHGSFVLESFNKLEIEPGIIEKGVIQNEDALVAIIKSACKNVRGKKLTTKYVIASLPEEKSFLQVIQMPKMTEEELRSAIFFEAENYIPLSVNEVYLDFQVIEPIKDHLDHVDVLIVAMPKKIVNSYVNCFKKAGLIPLVCEIESEAITRALIEKEMSAAPVALIDFGKDSTDFITFAGRSIQFTHSIPISSQQLTEAISEALSINMARAEKLKLSYDAMDAKRDSLSKRMAQVVEPILDDMALQIKKYLNFHENHASHEHLEEGGKIKNIFLCGGGSNLKGLPEFLTRKTGVLVELKNFWVHFPTGQMNDGIPKDFVSFATALGLALRKTDAF